MFEGYIVYTEKGNLVYAGATLTAAKEEAAKYFHEKNIVCYIYKRELIEIIGG